MTPVGPFAQIEANVNGSSEFKPYWYSVDYDLGVPYGVNDENNIREDTIENIRGGGIVLSLYEWGSQELTDKTALPGGELPPSVLLSYHPASSLPVSECREAD